MKATRLSGRARTPPSPSPSPFPICPGTGTGPSSPIRPGVEVHAAPSPSPICPESGTLPRPRPRFVQNRGLSPVTVPVLPVAGTGTLPRPRFPSGSPRPHKRGRDAQHVLVLRPSWVRPGAAGTQLVVWLYRTCKHAVRDCHQGLVVAPPYDSHEPHRDEQHVGAGVYTSS